MRPTLPSSFVRRLTHTLAVPALMAALILMVGIQVACVFKIPSWGNDEPPHLGYVATLANGELPTIDSPIMDDPERFGDLSGAVTGWDQAHNEIWVANHPPLFHYAMVPLWWASDGEPRSMFIGMRIANTIGFAWWVFLVGLIARELVPRRAVVPALASVVAVTPTLALRSGFFMNDGMSCAGGLLAVLMVIRMMRVEVTPNRVALAALGGTIAAGTRASGVLTVAICTIALLVVLVRREGWWRGLAVSAAVGGVPALLTGWFYIRNYRLYGDFTGQDALLQKFEREHVNLLDFWHIPGIDEVVLMTPLIILALGALSPLAFSRWLRHRGPQVQAPWVMMGVLGLVTAAQIAQFLATGGGFHDRYLMPIMPLLATVAALGMLHLGELRPTTVEPDRRDWLVSAVWSGVLLLWLAGALAWLEQFYIYGRQPTLPVNGPLPDLLVAGGVIVGVLVVVSMTIQARAQLSSEASL